MSCGENPTGGVLERDCVSAGWGSFCVCDLNDNNNERRTRAMGMRMRLIGRAHRHGSEPESARGQYTVRWKYEVRFMSYESKQNFNLL